MTRIVANDREDSPLISFKTLFNEFDMSTEIQEKTFVEQSDSGDGMRNIPNLDKRYAKMAEEGRLRLED